MPARQVLLLTFTLCLVACTSLEPIQPTRTKTGNPFYIAVVGDGVKTEEPIVRDHPLNNAQGNAMFQGAELAFSKSERTAELRKEVDLIGYDDGGTTVAAARIASKLAADPRVLAVIGHATSGTTRAGASIYAEAGIPLLMPIATSPYAAKPTGADAETSARLPNCFRLPLNDRPYQAAMVAYTALDLLGTKRVYLLRDISEDAAEYSGPLYQELEVLLGNTVVAKRRVDREQTNVPFIAESIRGYSVDLVVFAGYGTTAQELLHSLRVVYANMPNTRKPRLLFTDGCKTPEVDPTGFHTYTTFPAPDIFSSSLDGPQKNLDLDLLRKSVLASGNQSYEMYGYDATLLIAFAYGKCRLTNVSRACMAEVLSSRPLDAPGIIFPYEFANGDNTRADYSLFSSAAGEKGSFIFERTVPSSTLRSFYDNRLKTLKGDR